jgi:hypothetical protein
MRWEDATKQLTLEPAPPRGATNQASERTFRVLVLPEGASREVTYSGRRVSVKF